MAVVGSYKSSIIQTIYEDDFPLTNPAIVYFIGESNSGGLGLNEDALPDEITPKTNIQILNNDTFVFEDLHIDGVVATGKNNYIGHDEIDEDNPWHGWELQLAQRVVNNPPAYLVKCGQGGSSLDEWGDGSAYFNTFISRSNTAAALLSNAGIIPNIYVFVSMGLNDMLDGVSNAEYKALLIDWLDRIQSQLGTVKMFITQFQSMESWTQYDDTIAEVAEQLDYLTAIDTTGATLNDPRHWDYGGIKQICNSMIEAAEQ